MKADARALRREAAGLLGMLALPVAAAFWGAAGPQRIALNLGPGDGPYLQGFAPAYEIDDKVATHWTTYHAAVKLPVRVEGPAILAYRFSRVFPETAVLDVNVNGTAIDRFTCRGGVWEEKQSRVEALGPGPVRIAFDADSHERRDRGLKLDWIRLETMAGSRVRLTGAAARLPALTLALVYLLHRLTGGSARASLLLTAPWVAAAAWGLLRDPWLVHRLMRGLPWALVLFGLAGVGVGRWLVRRGLASGQAVRGVAALAIAAFLLRALFVNHPDFYYPDLRTHARLVEVVREAGLRFFATPSRYIWEHGVWRTEAYGKTYAFPYTPAFHVPFALLGLSYDSLLVALKLAAAAVSTVPIVLVWAMARRLGASPLGAGLMVLIPTYTSRLSFAFLPSLFGHAIDMAFLLWLIARADTLGTRRVWLAGAGWVAACQLAYVSGVVNLSLLVGVLALLTGMAVGWRRGLGLLAMGLVGSVVSVALYYRDFLPMASDLAGRVMSHAGPGGAASRYPIQSWLAVSYGRTADFFDHVYPVLTVVGMVALWRRGKAGLVLAAWVLTYFLLLLGRAKAPDIFLHGHETLLLTPLVCLASGEALAQLAGRGLWGRAGAGLAFGFLAAQGLWLQWRSIADQLANAR
jgi:hypothetical protein